MSSTTYYPTTALAWDAGHIEGAAQRLARDDRAVWRCFSSPIEEEGSMTAYLTTQITEYRGKVHAARVAIDNAVHNHDALALDLARDDLTRASARLDAYVDALRVLDLAVDAYHHHKHEPYRED